MEPEAFTDNAPGRLIQTIRGHWAFSPDPLPPALPLDWDLANRISAADRALSELAGIGRTLPNPHI